MIGRLTTTIANSFLFSDWILKSAEVITIATGVNALSIWIKDTLNLHVSLLCLEPTSSMQCC